MRWFIALLLLIPLPVLADNCGNGLPCGPVPWSLPALPRLASPTPMPTIVLTTVPPTPGAGTPTATPPAATATPTPSFNVSQITDSVATLSALSEATQEVIMNAEGTPVGLDGLDTIAPAAGQFFGYAKGFSDASFGSLSPVFTFTLISMVTITSVKMITFLLPIMAMIIKFLRNLLSLIADFLPL